MIQRSLERSGLYQLLINRNNSVAHGLAGMLILIEPEVAKTLEYIKTQFPGFTEHGMQHSLRIIEYIYGIMSEELKQNISDVEIFCFIMAAFFHDMGMALTDIEYKDEQRKNHHLYAAKPIKEFFDKYMQRFSEKRRLERCIIYISEAHGKSIEELYDDADFRKVDRIEGQVLRYGLLAILLRVGDLMDLEEGRICEFNMHLNSNYYNDSESMLHNSRHSDVKTYNYSSDRIYIAILTDDRQKYKIWMDWINYLDREVMYANTHYLTGKTSDFFRNYELPEVVKSVEPSDSAKFEVEEIRFQVDETGALWDILTKSIYTNEFDYVREVIQNAIDATLLKIYLDDEEDIKYKSPRSWKCNDKVIVAYSQKQGVLWIEDYGIGMSEGELPKYLFKTANSGYKYMKKREFVFPAIAQFGIGFVACLTKAEKIKILTRARGQSSIGAEIEAQSTVAFIEKNIERDYPGTTIMIQVKEKYSFSELKEYISKYFHYPSVEIDLVDTDILQKYTTEENLFNISSGFLRRIGYIKQRQEDELNKILPDITFLRKITGILIDNEKADVLINEIYKILNDNFFDTDVMKNIRSIVDGIEVRNDRAIQKIWKEVNQQKDIVDKKKKRYSEFLFQIHRREIEKIVDYKQLVLEIDNEFNTKKISTEIIKNEDAKGIIFIPTNFVDYDLGIEWRSINAFLFEHGRITKCIIKKVWDSMEDQVVYDDIFSIDEMNDIEYEIVEREEEIRSEKYYEEMSKKTFHEDYEEYKDLYDILILKNNNFYEIYGIDIETMGNIYEYNVDTGGSKFLECIVTVPEDYNGEKFNFKKSKLWQDGILLNFNPQYITPMGFCYVKANFTTEARFELNASRHELNNNREVINKWNKKIGNIIQKKVAENCISVLRENNIDFEINNLLAQDEEDPFAKENVLLMRKVLNELLYENTCNLPCTNK